MQIAQARPPFVEFKQVAVENPKKSVELGYRFTEDVDFVHVMQPGSGNLSIHEAIAVDWLAQIKRKFLENSADAMPQEWVDGFHKKYELWKQGKEAPLMGTSVKEWPLLSPAEVENYQSLGIMTIEDIAAMTEEALGRVGMGAREKRDKARDWLKGKEISDAAMKENAELKAQLAEMQAQIAELMADKPKRGRQPKEQ